MVQLLLSAPKLQGSTFVLPCSFDFSRILQELRGGKQAMLAQVGGIYRRLDSPRLGLSTVRRAQAATPVIRTKHKGHPEGCPLCLV